MSTFQERADIDRQVRRDLRRIAKRWAEIIAYSGDPGPVAELSFMDEIAKTGRIPKVDWRAMRPTHDDELLDVQAARLGLARAQAALGGKRPKQLDGTV
jgi:hypothetical protein